MKWKCQKCGSCCKGEIVKKILPEFYDKNKDRCINLTDDNLCSIYNNRPIVCNINMFNNIYDLEISDKELIDYCKTLQKKNGDK